MWIALFESTVISMAHRVILDLNTHVMALWLITLHIAWDCKRTVLYMFLIFLILLIAVFSILCTFLQLMQVKMLLSVNFLWIWAFSKTHHKIAYSSHEIGCFVATQSTATDNEKHSSALHGFGKFEDNSHFKWFFSFSSKMLLLYIQNVLLPLLYHYFKSIAWVTQTTVLILYQQSLDAFCMKEHSLPWNYLQKSRPAKWIPTAAAAVAL